MKDQSSKNKGKMKTFVVSKKQRINGQQTYIIRNVKEYLQAKGKCIIWNSTQRQKERPLKMVNIR